jgi:immune inhibitor A
VNRRITGVVGVAAALGLAATALPGNAQAVNGAKHRRHVTASQTTTPRPDNRPDALQKRKSALRQKAVDDLIAGKAKTVGKGPKRTIEMADGTSVDYPVTQTAQLLTFLVDFGDGAGNPDFEVNTAGPVHNDIPQPSVLDNSTYWEKGFSRQHYLDMFFNGLPDQGGESFHDFYKEMSSGRFDLRGDVSDWVTVPHPESFYQEKQDVDGDPSTPETGEDTGKSMTNFLQDSATAWYDAQKSTMSDDDIKDYLSQFDQWDRYDYDNDGVYDEADGYIDHFQAIHAGEGEEAGAPTWTIWSHRSSVQPYAKAGPASNPAGGIQIGNTGFWIRDYTTEPENGGLGVFAHEFGHDLGLPDFYDTQGGDNSTGFWTLMSSGSWMGHGKGTLGTTPDHMGANEKLFLGWYGTTGLQDSADLKIVRSDGDPQNVTLGPSYHASPVGAQALAVSLPDGHATVDVVEPEQGTHYLYSGAGDDRIATATSPEFAVPADDPRLKARVSYSLEDDFDYGYARISTDGGVSWNELETDLSTTTDPNTANQGFGITGCSGDRDADGNCDPVWVDLSADLAAYAGQQVKIQFMTTNDTAYHELGLAVDEVSVGTALKEDFENGGTGWILKKGENGPAFVVMNGSSYVKQYPQYYLAENRTYRGYDTTLAQGPYSWDYQVSAPDKRVDQFPYQDGLLIWYVNGLYDDNNTNHVIGHPGGGQSLPVDANPRYVPWTKDGRPYDYADGRLETYDATFDVDRTAGLHLTSETEDDGTVRYDVDAHPSVSAFDDSDPDAYWDPTDAITGWYSTRVAGSGTSITVLSDDKATGRMEVRVAPVAPRATVQPSIKGTPRYASRLIVAPGTWTLDPAVTYQWLSNGTPIGGATGTSFTPTLAQLGKTLTVRATATTAGHPTGTATTAGVKVLPAPVTMSVKAPKSVRKGKKATITVTVSSAGLTPGGTISVSRGHGAHGVATVQQGGRATVRIKLTRKGKNTLVVAYTPSTGFSGAPTQRVTVKVK